LVIGPLEFYVHIADNASADLLADGPAGTHISGLAQPTDGNASAGSSDTMLLDHLKSLNPKTTTESEPPVLDLLKKFL